MPRENNFARLKVEPVQFALKNLYKASRYVSWTISTRQPLIRNKVGGEEQERRSAASGCAAASSGSSRFLFRCHLRAMLRKTYLSRSGHLSR